MAIFDFSEYQGTIDFGKVKGNTDLLILRVQAGSTHPDIHYAQYVAGCKANGIPFGTYAYGKFISVSDAQVEARDCYNRMDKGSSVVVLDVEEVDCPANQLVPATQAFIDYLHSQGVKKVGLYSGEYFYKDHGLSAVKCDFLWLANYGVNDGQMHTKPSIACDLWQYSSTATENGVVGHVDIDTLNGTKPLSYFTGIETLDFIGCVDVPSAGQSVPYDKFTVSGWFLNSGGVGTVQILIDSDTQTYAWGTYGDNREDVQKAYPQYNNANSGYHCEIDTKQLGLGDHTLTVIGYSTDNKSSLKLPTVTFKVDSITLPIGSMATIKTTATNYAEGAVIPDDVKGKQFKVTSVNNIAKTSYSIKQYVFEGLPYHILEQDIVETGISNGSPYPPASTTPVPELTPAPTPQPAPVPVVPAPTPVVAPVVEQKPAPVPVEVPVPSVPKPEEVPVAPSAPTVATMAQQIEDAVMKDPQLQKNFAQKILDFFVSLFK